MRQADLKIKRSRGFLLIVAILVLVVIAVAIAALGNMTSADIRSSSAHSQSEQAYFTARSGLDYASYQLAAQPGVVAACASLTNTSASVGSAVFSITGTLYAPANTSLSAILSANAAIIPVASLAGYAAHGRVRIDLEEINYSGTSASAAVCGIAPCLTGAMRGEDGTQAAAHALGAAVSQTQCLIRSRAVQGNAVRTLERAMAVAVNAMLVYTKGANVVFYRAWNTVTNSWGAEQTGPTMGAAVIQTLVLRMARTRNEAILVTMDSAGDMYLSMWTGAAFPTPASRLCNIGAGIFTNSRGFDVAYESGSDNAIFVHDDCQAGVPRSHSWNGTAWTPALPVNQNSIGTLTNVGAATPAVNIPRWVELAANPNSNEIAMIVLQGATGSTATRAVRGGSWSGIVWTALGGAGTWGVPTNANIRKAVAVAYEQVAGTAMFAWSNNATNGRVNYRVYNGTALATSANVTIATSTSIGEWLRLASRPGTDQIMLGLQSATRQLDTRFYNGAAWDAGAYGQHDAATQIASFRNFDLAWEAYPRSAGGAWLVYGDGATVSRKLWNGVATWSAATTFGSNTSLVQLYSQPLSDRVYAAYYENTASGTDDINANTMQGSGTTGPAVWPAPAIIWGGATVNTPVGEKVFVAGRPDPAGWGLGAGSGAASEEQEIFP